MNTANIIDNRKPIGRLAALPGFNGYHVVGRCCMLSFNGDMYARIYAVNIYPYKQTCCCCGAVLIEGGNGWCELYNGR